MTVDLNLGHTRAIIGDCLELGLIRTQIAYVLATAYWETAHTMRPVKEAFWLSEDWRRQNLRYYPWYGRGYVQITWEDNYRRMGDMIGVDLITDPEKTLEPDIARPLLNRGFISGAYTGHKLSRHINDDKTDYVNARRCINGTDKAKTIAQLAHEYEYALALEDIGVGPSLEPAGLPVIRKGSRGAAVMIHQQDLKALGYFAGKVNGEFETLTDNATRNFQADHGLDVDGVVGRMTRTAMRDAKPRPERDVSEADLRAAGSGTIDDADQGEALTKRSGAGVFGLGGVDTGLAFVDKLATSQSTIEAAQATLMENWLVLGIMAAGGLVWWKGPKIMASIRGRRVADARSNAHLGR